MQNLQMVKRLQNSSYNNLSIKDLSI